MLTKLNALILGCIFLFVTPLMSSEEDSNSPELSSGPHQARIITPRAIVYSDENLNSPLGYISNNKLITVGNPRKKNPDIVPLVVYGRVAYIESKNIQYENETLETLSQKRGAPREHNIDLVLNKPEERLSENNSYYFSLHEFSGGMQINNLFKAIDDEDKSFFTGIDLSVIHRQLTGKFFWGAGFEYNTLSSTHVKFDLFSFSPIAGYTPARNSLFMIDLFAALDVITSAQLKIKTISHDQPNAFAYGPQFGGRIVFFPNLNYHISGTLSYRSYKVLRIETIDDGAGNSIEGVSKINGINLGIGVAFEI